MFELLVLFLFLLVPLHNCTRASKNIVVLITGCSSGIGEALALAFAEYNYDASFNVYATMRDIKKWNHQAKDNINVLPMDVTDSSTIDVAIDKIIEKEGKIDIVINNAGYGLSGCLEGVTIEEGKDLFDVNVWGVVRVLHGVLPHMRKRKWGHIINISSTSGIRGIPCLEYYTASKFALEGLTDSMRYSLASYNISITNINAGPIKTKFTERFGNIDKGGKGTRAILNDDTSYLTALSDLMIHNLNRRMDSNEAQSSHAMAQVVIHIAILKFQSTLITQVPFNIGTNEFSQDVLQSFRKYPTGWGGNYTAIFTAIPKIGFNIDNNDEL